MNKNESQETNNTQTNTNDTDSNEHKTNTGISKELTLIEKFMRLDNIARKEIGSGGLFSKL